VRSPGEPGRVRMRVVDAAAMSPALVEAWARVQESEPELASPFLRPEFTLAVASLRSDVRVGVIELDGSPAGFLPFVRRLGGVGAPVASMVSDCQAVIVGRDVRWTADEVLTGCGLCGMEFNHLLTCQQPWRPFHGRVADSPLIDLRAGYEAYRKERRDAGSEQIRKVEGLARKLEREVGPLRFEASSGDPSHLQWLVERKRAQCDAKGRNDAMSTPLVRALLDRLLTTREPAFAGMLSCLWAGERLVAAHMGMRSRTRWHYWFPCYEESLAKYSPGIILLLRMAEVAPSLGLDSIDMGKGDAPYKQRLMNASSPVCEATAWADSPMAAMARWIVAGRRSLRRSPFMGAARTLQRWLSAA
jgi:CelD/BcsL family acetyltransferase involved in cellulose biosynthesis